jgi:nitrogen fixation protein FixH
VAKGQEGLYAGARIIDTSTVVAAATEGGHAGMPGTSTTPTPHPGETSAQAGTAAMPGKLQIAMPSKTVKLSGGNAKLRIEVKDGSGAPVSDAKVDVAAGMPGMDVGKTPARATKDAGAYEATLKLGMAGAWTVQVTATPPQGTSTMAKFNLEAQ